MLGEIVISVDVSVDFTVTHFIFQTMISRSALGLVSVGALGTLVAYYAVNSSQTRAVISTYLPYSLSNVVPIRFFSQVQPNVMQELEPAIIVDGHDEDTLCDSSEPMKEVHEEDSSTFQDDVPSVINRVRLSFDT